jgi:inward rectifier potassium channel
LAKLLHKNPLPEPKYNDLGFGTKVGAPAERMLNQDGSFNVIRRGVKGQGVMNLYNSLITMPWPRFAFFLLAYFFFVNLLFAGLYTLAGFESLGGDMGETYSEKFWNAFFFSAQTITTVGYGHIHPVGTAGNIIAAIESLTGLLGFALATGLLYGKFSRPVAKINFSDTAIIAPYKDITAFMFRIANMRNNQLMDLSINVNFSMVSEIDGKKERRFSTFKLERESIKFFPTSWTIVHPIDEDSPLHGITKEQLIAGNPEILILLSAFDDTFSQTVHSRTSYKGHEIIWGAKFKTMMGTPQNGNSVLLLDKISDIEMVDLVA